MSRPQETVARLHQNVSGLAYNLLIFKGGFDLISDFIISREKCYSGGGSKIDEAGKPAAKYLA